MAGFGMKGKGTLYALAPTLLIFLVLEGILGLIGFEGTSMAELIASQGMNPGAYVHRRDRILGAWYVPEDGDSAWVQSNPALLSRGFHRERFPREQGEGVRFFALGGSTTQGAPFENKTRGFPGRMEAILREEGFPGSRVINAGVAGMGSAGFPTVAREALSYDPDGLLIYAGNNEIVGQLIEECTDPYRVGLERALNEVGTVRLFRTAFVYTFGSRQLRAMPPVERRQTDCLLEHVATAIPGDPIWDSIERWRAPGPGEAWPRRQDALYRRTLDSFRESLETVIGQAEARDIPVWLAIPPIHPFPPPRHAQSIPTLHPEARRTVGLLDARLSSAVDAGDLPGVVALTGELLAIDPTDAAVHHRRGLALLELGQVEEARVHLELAAEWDYLGRRVTPSLQDVVREVCAAHALVGCVDVDAAFQAAAKPGLPGPDLFVDFCHPTRATGTDLIAWSFLKAMTEPGEGGDEGAR